MKKVLSWLWCFPQNLIGVVLYGICKAKGNQTFKYKDAAVCVYGVSRGVSLGNYIFIPLWVMLDTEKENYIKHEYGHTLQSKKLGIFYIAILLLSMVWSVCFRKYRAKHKVSYYSFFTEKWADELGGVYRVGAKVYD